MRDELNSNPFDDAFSARQSIERQAMRQVQERIWSILTTLGARLKHEKRILLRSIQSTADVWQQLKPDLLEIVRREAERTKEEIDQTTRYETRSKGPGGRWKSGPKRTPPRPSRPNPHGGDGEIWFQWTGRLELLRPSLPRLLSLPREARILALTEISEDLSDWSEKPLAYSNMIKKMEDAVFFLAGDRLPDLAAAVAQQVGGDLLIVANKKTARYRYVRIRSGRNRSSAIIRIPRWELFNLEQSLVARRFEEAAGSPSKKAPVLFIGGDTDYVSRELLPNHFTARTFDRSMRFADRHLNSLVEVAKRTVDPTNVAFFNGMPQSKADVKAFRAEGLYRTWLNLRRKFEKVQEEFDVESSPSSREAFLAELATGAKDVIIVVAHGTEDGIFLRPGERVSREDIINLKPRSSGPAPLVLLLACRTGAVEKGSRAIAQTLLYRGYASAVIAPTQLIRPREELAEFLRSVLRGGRLEEVLRARPKELELWVRVMGLDSRRWWREALG
jgi:hypothetical protein